MKTRSSRTQAIISHGNSPWILIATNKVLATICTLFAFIVTATAAVTLVENGAPVAEIVIADDAPQGVKLAAEDLQKHLKLISDAQVPIVTNPSADVANQIYVGPSEFTEKLGFQPTVFSNSGLEVLAKDNYLILDGPLKQWQPSPYTQTRSDSEYLKGSIITGVAFPKPEDFPSEGLKAWQDFCGEKFTTHHLNGAPGAFNKPLEIHVNDDIGPWYAVAELLEQLGVRWYMPYEDGTVVPKMRTISVPEQHLTKEAEFAMREWTYYGTMRSDGEGISWLKRLKAGSNQVIVYNHTTYAIYSSYEQQLAHPEYLAKDSTGAFINGYPSGRGMPRYTDPGFRKAAVTYMNKVLESQPDLTAITIGPPDGGVRMDARDVDKFGTPDDSMEQKTSNYVWDFHVYLANELKKSHPDKFLLYMSGAGAGKVPTNIEEFPENLLVPPNMRPSSLWGLNAIRKARLRLLHEWTEKMEVVHKAPSWDHWLSYRTPSRPRYPVVFTKALQDQMVECEPYITGKFIEIQPGKIRNEDGTETTRLGVRGLVHLMVYLQNKLFWDPNLDREKLLDEYYRLFFGPAEAEMREFYEFAEAVWSRQESRSLTESTGFLKEKDVDKYFEILARAKNGVEEGSVYHRRITTIESEMQSLTELFPSLKRTGPDFQARMLEKPPTIDGSLDEYEEDAWTNLLNVKDGEPITENPTKATIALTPDKSALIIAVDCAEEKMDELKADCVLKDDFSIFQDDVIEVYVNTPQYSYFKIVVNPNGAVWTESTDVAIIDRDTLPILWNPGVEAVVTKHPDRWTCEILIPTGDFGDLGPTKEHPWGIQVGRTRFTGGTASGQAIAPTFGGPYRTLNKWGNLMLE